MDHSGARDSVTRELTMDMEQQESPELTLAMCYVLCKQMFIFIVCHDVEKTGKQHSNL